VPDEIPWKSNLELLAERVTAATDYLLAAVALFGALRLDGAAKRTGHLSIRFWAGGFAAIGAAALLGGSWHGFSHRLGADAAALLWKATLAAAGVADFLMIAGAAFASVPRHAARWTVGAGAGKLAIFLLWALPGDAFVPVVADTALTLLAVCALQWFAGARRRAPSAPWILAGVAVSVSAAVIEAVRPSLLPPFGPDAAYHLIQLGGLLLFLRGGMLFYDTKTAPVPRALQSNTSG
jgi:hypothetical protein